MMNSKFQLSVKHDTKTGAFASSAIDLLATPLIDCNVGDVSHSIVRPSRKNFGDEQKQLSCMEEYVDGNFNIAVLGSTNCGKAEILEKECQKSFCDEDSIQIQIMDKLYSIEGRSVRVEYWNTPENSKYCNLSSRFVSGQAATIFFFDVTRKDSLTKLIPWIESMMSTDLDRVNINPFGYQKYLIANNIDFPGKRVIFQEDGYEFATKYDMEYFETSPSDDLESIHDIFNSIVSRVTNLIPSHFNRHEEAKSEDPYPVPFGLQLGLALETTLKLKYRTKLKLECSSTEVTEVVDWI
ncbi:P-loop containing nucleoside triphosphate hydrolase protein [Globomyces pollinis-pini]|nr:P-loop containing nucleoside triphosphate hydrolase protein [Globomyces pollinis-pini]